MNDISVAGDVNCSHLAVNRPKIYEQLARALSDFYETAKGYECLMSSSL